MEFQNQEQSLEDVEFQELVSTLPHRKDFAEYIGLYLYQGTWITEFTLKSLISFPKLFKLHDTDIMLASLPKSGTTWLKAIIYLIANRSCFALRESPLLTSSPHDLVPFLEFDLLGKSQCPDLEKIPDPRIFATHIAYQSLPNSITGVNSNCKIVYVCRNPLDQFISYWAFLSKVFPDSVTVSLEEAFELYCKGIHFYGPFWDHVLGYWKASQEHPEKVLFLKYEDLKLDNILCTEKLAEFLGFPFSAEEKEEGVVEEICSICSFVSLKSLETNEKGTHPTFSEVPNSAFFRKGKVGDWKNYLSPSMAERMDKLLEEKLKGSGLSFDLYNKTKK